MCPKLKTNFSQEISEGADATIKIRQSGKSYTFSTNKFLKELLRSFRSWYKIKFYKLHKFRAYHWVSSSKRNKIREFFTQNLTGTPIFSIEDYEKWESIFYSLMFNTVKDLQSIGIDNSDPFITTMS